MKRARITEASGFTFIEMVVAMGVTTVVMASVFLLLQKGNRSFRREPQITETTAAARIGIDRISQDLTIAGFNAPPERAIMWFDGGGPATAPNPDMLTLVYSDPEVPWSRPLPCKSGGGGSCNTIGSSSTLNVDPSSLPPYVDPEQAYNDGQILMALQGPNGNPACDNVEPGLYPFEVTQRPKCTGAGAGSGSNCDALNINHNPSDTSGLNYPGGFQNEVLVDCAVIGWFHIVQYRINPLPPTPNPMLERSDLLGDSWTPVSNNIENLQVRYAQGTNPAFFDVPPLVP
ncbi:MAG TPA: hypothetical protein VEK15_26245, partial [Vicinamibacteria bacterium]|nr:hypothetical protein [Vicinamibacteria bacterium]